MATKFFLFVLLVVTVHLNKATDNNVYPGPRYATQTLCFNFLVNSECEECSSYNNGVMCCECAARLLGKRPKPGSLTCDIQKKKLHVGCLLIGMRKDTVFDINSTTLDIDGYAIKVVQRSNDPDPVRRRSYNLFMTPLHHIMK